MLVILPQQWKKLDGDKQSETNLIDLVTKDVQKNLENAKIELEMKSRVHYSNEGVKQRALSKLQNEIKEFEDKIIYVICFIKNYMRDI